ncbi:hypothetical protein SAMN05216378_1424 [Paenibacillus catalpae]|uniref:Thioredoxin n=1 Tax=Paenibacillus catalpae TaxID=1045775 RepID=A0A1I1V7B5_9BACL|nr:hypothetical protein SAMN05216378_1424 [Paenibacillus catalpae]
MLLSYCWKAYFLHRQDGDQLVWNINKINNQLRPKTPIKDISFIDVREKHKYNYEKVFELKDFPQILVFENKEIVLRTKNPNELYVFYYDKLKN